MSGDNLNERSVERQHSLSIGHSLHDFLVMFGFKLKHMD
ncbi:hypothetical protein FOHLNKBM_3818 [Methylobacterium longum]|nr:hypothetical protein FOHLNKBM_3818 [Methylobacterium longum]